MTFHNDKKNDAKHNEQELNLESDDDLPPQESLTLTKTFQGTTTAIDKTITMQTWAENFTKKHFPDPINAHNLQTAAEAKNNYKIRQMKKAYNQALRNRGEIKILVETFTRYLSQASSASFFKSEDNEKNIMLKYLIIPAYHLSSLAEKNLLTQFITEACDKLKLKNLGDQIRILIETTNQWTQTRQWESRSSRDFKNAVFPEMVAYLAGLKSEADVKAKIKSIAAEQKWHGTDEIASEYIKAIQDKIQEPLSKKPAKP